MPVKHCCVLYNDWIESCGPDDQYFDYSWSLGDFCHECKRQFQVDDKVLACIRDGCDEFWHEDCVSKHDFENCATCSSFVDRCTWAL